MIADLFVGVVLVLMLSLVASQWDREGDDD